MPLSFTEWKARIDPHMLEDENLLRELYKEYKEEYHLYNYQMKEPKLSEEV